MGDRELKELDIKNRNQFNLIVNLINIDDLDFYKIVLGEQTYKDIFVSWLIYLFSLREKNILKTMTEKKNL